MLYTSQTILGIKKSQVFSPLQRQSCIMLHYLYYFILIIKINFLFYFILLSTLSYIVLICTTTVKFDQYFILLFLLFYFNLCMYIELQCVDLYNFIFNRSIFHFIALVQTVHLFYFILLLLYRQYMFQEKLWSLCIINELSCV